MSSVLEPSAWVTRFAARLQPGATVLDVACGSGRHARWLAARGLQVTALDRDADALADLGGLAQVRTLLADIENHEWPLKGVEGQPLQFNAVVVTNYLWRPLFGVLAQSVALGGMLIHETFAAGNERYGKPSRPDFLLQPAELLRAYPGLQVLAFEDGVLDTPRRCVQRAALQRAPLVDEVRKL